MDDFDDAGLDEALSTYDARNVNKSAPARAAPAEPLNKGAPVVQPTPQRLPRPPGFNAVLVSTRQKGNPVLSHIKNVPWEYGDIVPDYVVGASTCVLFLSLRYHRLHPEYIYNRMQVLGRSYNLRILLIWVDIENHSDPLRELTKTSVVNNLTIVLAWSIPEAGRYLETFKSLEHANPSMIQERPSDDVTTRMVDTITSVRSINKNDAIGLLGTVGSLRKAFNTSEEELASVAGWGAIKVKRFHKAVNEPFVVNSLTTRRQNPIPSGRSTKQVAPASTLTATVEDAQPAKTNVNGGEKESSTTAGVMSALAKLRDR